MNVTWRDDLTTGNSHIDNQHRQLLQKIADLVNACKERREQHEVTALISYLKQYVQDHFSAEEAWQARHGYNLGSEHARQHDELVRRLAMLEEMSLREGITLPVVTTSLKLTYEWLTEHILHWDREMATFVAAREGAGTGHSSNP
jgi:hemerythrin